MAEMGDTDVACHYANQAIAICEGDPSVQRLVVTMDGYMGAVASQRGSTQEIVVSNVLNDEFKEDLDSALKRALTLKDVEGSAHGNLARIALALGNSEVAEDEWKKALRIHEEVGFIPGIAMSLGGAGRGLALRREKPDEACANWMRAENAYKDSGNTEFAAKLALRIQQMVPTRS